MSTDAANASVSRFTLVRGGTVVDGTGTPGFVADVAIEHGTIVAVAPDLHLDPRFADATMIDASGCVVAPGFIDIHTHYDAQVFWDPALDAVVLPRRHHGGGRQLRVLDRSHPAGRPRPDRPHAREGRGHGSGIARRRHPVGVRDLPASTSAAVESHGSVLNYAAYIGHTPLRIYVMGDDASERTATDDEIEQMSALVREAIDAGACGFATSFAVTHLGADGRPIPSRWAGRGEIDALCAAVADAGRGVVGINGVSDGLHFDRDLRPVDRARVCR